MDAKITISFKSIPLCGTYLATQKLSLYQILYNTLKFKAIELIQNIVSNENIPKMIIDK